MERFKKYALGIAIMILTITFIFVLANAIFPRPERNYYKYDYDYSYDTYRNELDEHNQKIFAVVVVLSTVAIGAGVFVHSVAPISLGLIFAGSLSILFVSLANFYSFTAPIKVLVTGSALAGVTALAYYKLKDEKPNVSRKIPKKSRSSKKSSKIKKGK